MAFMGFVLRNWHLKLAAVALATVLYTGFVYSGTLAEDDIQVPVQAINQPASSYNLSGELGLVQVRYRTRSDTLGTVTADAFVARVDLSEYDMDRPAEPQLLQIRVSEPEGIDIVDVTPDTIRVELDRTETRTVPIEVDTGEIPDGLELGDLELSEDDGQVEVQGPASIVGQVDRALARIAIDASGIDVDEPVELIAVDIEGQPVGSGRVELSPRIISVRVEVEAVETTKTVPVTPAITGTPAPGYALESLAVTPSTVTLRGLPEALTDVTEVATEGLDIGGAAETQAFDAALVLPEGTELARSGAEPVVTVEAVIGPSVATRSFVVGLTCQGAGTNGCQPLLPQLTLTLSGPSTVLGALGGGEVTPFVDVSGLAPGTYSMTPLIPALPEGVEVLQLVPGTVSVRIVAPATPTPAP